MVGSNAPIIVLGLEVILIQGRLPSPLLLLPLLLLLLLFGQLAQDLYPLNESDQLVNYWSLIIAQVRPIFLMLSIPPL